MTEPDPVRRMSAVHRTETSHPLELPFVGRNSEMTWLLAALDPRTTPPDRLRLVAGNAGVGKSRLMIEAAKVAASRGWRVVWGRCWNSEVTPPYWPWTQVARQLLGTKGVALGEVLLGEAAPVERFEVFDAMTELISDTSRTAPLMIVLEDVHEADSASLLLMRFLALHLVASPALILGTLRTADDGRLSAALQLDDATSRGIVRELSPLDLPAVREILSDSPIATDVHTVTGGNPLLIEQLGLNDGFHDVHDGKRESLYTITTERVSQLPIQTRHALSAIAVLASQPALTRAARVLDIPVSDLMMRLRPALDADIVVYGTLSDPDDSSRVRIRHQLFADAVLKTEADDALRDLHGRVASLYGSEHGREAQRAHHLLLAGPARLQDAVAACRDASRIAAEAGVYDDAIAHLRRALAAGDAITAWSPADRVRVVLELGRIQSAVGDHVSAAEAFDEAWDIARQHADYDALGHAALGPRLQFNFTGPGPVHRAELCREALRSMPAEPAPLRIQVLATLAIAQLVDRDPLDSRRTARAALEMAEDVQDPVARGYALLASIVTDLGPATLDQRLSAAREVLSIASDSGNRELAANGHFLLLGALMEQGNIRGVDRELESRNRLTGQFTELADGRHAGWLRCMRAQLDGQPDEAERLAHESFAIAERDNDPDRMIVWAAQIAIVRWLQGRVSEIEPMFLEARRIQPDAPAWAATLAWLWVRSDRSDAARGVVHEMPALDAIPRDRNWLVTMATLAEVAVALDDTELADGIREELLPYAERMVPIGLGVACWGTVARPLALVAASQHRRRETVTHYRTAIRTASRCGAHPWLAECQLELAEFLAEHDGEHEEIWRLIAEADATARQLCLPALNTRIDEFTARYGRVEMVPDAALASTNTGSRPRVNVLGMFEVASAQGQTAFWNSRKARELLKVLIARFGQPVAREQLMEILWPEQQGPLGNRLSVATTAVRRALDPNRDFPTDFYLKSDGAVLTLRADRISVDVWEFVSEARSILASVDPTAPAQLQAARGLIDAYRGDALVDEPYSDWAEAIRTEAQTAFCSLLRLHALAAADDGDHVLASQACQRILRMDPYDSLAHEGLIAALTALGAHGQAQTARKAQTARMAEVHD